MSGSFRRRIVLVLAGLGAVLLLGWAWVFFIPDRGYQGYQRPHPVPLELIEEQLQRMEQADPRYKALPPEERIRREIAFLTRQLARKEKGIVKTEPPSGLIQLVETGSEAPEALRNHGEATPDLQTKKMLTLALGMTGTPIRQSALPELLRMARSDQEPWVRKQALDVLITLVPLSRSADIPKHPRPGEVRHPLPEATQREIAAVFLDLLDDPHWEMDTHDKVQGALSYPIRTNALYGLVKMGFRLENIQRADFADPVGRAVLKDSKGQTVRTIVLERLISGKELADYLERLPSE